MRQGVKMKMKELLSLKLFPFTLKDLIELISLDIVLSKKYTVHSFNRVFFHILAYLIKNIKHSTNIDK